jgi:hypothetical protein
MVVVLETKVVVIIIGHSGSDINNGGNVGEEGGGGDGLEGMCVEDEEGGKQGNIAPELSPWWARGTLPGVTVVCFRVHDIQNLLMTPQAKSMPRSLRIESRLIPKTIGFSQGELQIMLPSSGIPAII